MQGTLPKPLPAPVDMPGWAIRLHLHAPPTLASQWIRQLRKVTGVTQEELAEGLDVDVSTVQLWEYGAYQPKLDSVVRLLVFEARHVIDGTLTIEHMLFHRLLTTQGAIRSYTAAKEGRTFDPLDRDKFIDALVLQLQQLKAVPIGQEGTH